MAALLSVDKLGVVYGSGVHVVRDASLTVEPGEFVALLGSNGAGKTTLLRAISGLLAHHGGRVMGGTITVAGHDLVRMPGHLRARIGVTQTFEGRRILRDFTVEENLLAGAIKAPAAAIESRLGEIYRQFPILEKRRKGAAGLLSGGEQQMLAIARALVSDPTLILFDEPSLGLAPIMITQVAKTLRAVRELGKTVLLVEQNAHLALELADRAYVMQNGTIVAEGRAADLKNQDTVQHFYLGIGEASLPVRQRAKAKVTS